jgi:hypothetical protein
VTYAPLALSHAAGDFRARHPDRGDLAAAAPDGAGQGRRRQCRRGSLAGTPARLARQSALATLVILVLVVSGVANDWIVSPRG